MMDFFDLAGQHGSSFYDAAYLDLWLRERLPIATLDKALIRAAERSGVERSVTVAENRYREDRCLH